MNGDVVKAGNAVMEFLTHEASEYSQFDDYKLSEIEEFDGFFCIEVDFEKASKTIHFRASKVAEAEELDDVKLEVCMYEDIYEEVDWCTWRVKYFWLALLL